MRLASTCVTILLTISRQEVLNFHISGFIRRKKALKMGKFSLFKLLLEMKLFVTRQTRRVFCERITSLSFLQRHATLVDLCNNNSN